MESGSEYATAFVEKENALLMQIVSRLNLHKKSSEVSIKTRSTPASLSFRGQDPKHTTAKRSIGIEGIS